MGKQHYLEFWKSDDIKTGVIINQIEVERRDGQWYVDDAPCGQDIKEALEDGTLPLGDKTLDSIVVQSDIPDATVEAMIAKIEVDDEHCHGKVIIHALAVLRNGLHVSHGTFYRSPDPITRQETIDFCMGKIRSSVRDLLYFLILTARNGLSVPKE